MISCEKSYLIFAEISRLLNIMKSIEFLSILETT